MKRPIFFVWPGLMLWSLCFIARPGTAECRYFRTGYKLTKCKLLTPEEAKAIDMSNQQESDPDLTDTTEGSMVKITCACDYSLSGSDPLCDFDKSEDHSTYLPAPDPAQTCKQGKDLCDKVCQKQIN